MALYKSKPPLAQHEITRLYDLSAVGFVAFYDTDNFNPHI